MAMRLPAAFVRRAVALVGWASTLVGALLALLGYLMARDDVLVEAASPWLLSLYILIATTFYRLTGTYINHDVLELLVGALAFSGATFGVGLLIGQASARRDRGGDFAR